MDDEVEAAVQDAEERSWVILRALAQEDGMTDPSELPDEMQQLLWMGIKAGCAGAAEMMRGLQ